MIRICVCCEGGNHRICWTCETEREVNKREIKWVDVCLKKRLGDNHINLRIIKLKNQGKDRVK